MALNDFTGHTNWQGLWYHPEDHNYTSAVINLKALREFKGNIRLRMFKNKRKGERQPAYLFTISSTKEDSKQALEILDDEEDERMYSYEEVRNIVRDAMYAAKQGYDAGDIVI